MKLPEVFQNKIKKVLGEEFQDFLDSYGRPRRRGLRINRSKISPEEFAAEAGASWGLEKIPWTENGFYFSSGVKAGQHPYYAAGLYYLQEPSAMRPAECLPVCPGDRILDLCAAPGGKATELAVRLAMAEKRDCREPAAGADGGTGRGILAANEIDPSRTRALLRNLELTGMRNYCVLNETPERLAGAFPEYFDKILVDAPCSGEGMFRKEEAALALWSQERVEACARMQKEILEQAYTMLKPGGKIVYSTCTFSPEEDEEQIAAFTAAHPDMRVLKQERLWPHKVEGEGHFLALMEKTGAVQLVEEPARKKNKKRSGTVRPNREQMELLREFSRGMSEASGLASLSKEDIEIRQERAYLPAIEAERLQGLHVIRNGLYLGDWKKNRFEPSQALALSLQPGDYSREWHLQADDSRMQDFLRGESISLEQPQKAGDTGRKTDALSEGWTLICADRWPVGWGKNVKGNMKNHYPSGWRNRVG